MEAALCQGCDFKSPRYSSLFSLSVLLFERSVLTLYVEEKVGADEGECHHRDRQSTVRHHLSDFVIQIRAVGEATHISPLCDSDVINSMGLPIVFTVGTLLGKIIHFKH